MKEHLNYIDIAKGLCMLFIMLGHCATETVSRENLFIVTWVYSFHTIAFFIITGMLIEHTHEYERPSKKIIVSNFKRLMVPYYCFQFLYLVWFCCFNGKSSIKWMTAEYIFHVDWPYATWFLITLFLSKIIYIAMRKYLKSLTTCICILLFCVGLILPFFKISMLFPWIYNYFLRTLVAIGFLHFGILVYNYRCYLNNIFLLILFCLTSLITSYANHLVSPFNAEYNNPLLFTVSAISGSLFVLCLSTHLKSRFLTYFGNNSVIALGSHELILKLFPIKSIYNWFLLVPITTLIIYIYIRLKYLVKSDCQ